MRIWTRKPLIRAVFAGASRTATPAAPVRGADGKLWATWTPGPARYFYEVSPRYAQKLIKAGRAQRA